MNNYYMPRTKGGLVQWLFEYYQGTSVCVRKYVLKNKKVNELRAIYHGIRQRGL